MQDGRNSGDCVIISMYIRLLNCTLKTIRMIILCYICFTTILKSKFNQSNYSQGGKRITIKVYQQGPKMLRMVEKIHTY